MAEITSDIEIFGTADESGYYGMAKHFKQRDGNHSHAIHEQYLHRQRLLQKTHSDVRTLVFGDPSENVQLLGLLAVHIKALGHYFEVTRKTQMEVIQKWEEIVLSERVKKAKKGGDMMKRDSKIKFVKEWMEKNFEMLLEESLVE